MLNEQGYHQCSSQGSNTGIVIYMQIITHRVFY